MHAAEGGGRLGGFGPLALCTRVSNALTLTDPATLRSVLLDVRHAHAHHSLVFAPEVHSRVGWCCSWWCHLVCMRQLRHVAACNTD